MINEEEKLNFKEQLIFIILILAISFVFAIVISDIIGWLDRIF